MMPVYVVNLKRSEKRRRAIEKELSNAGLSYEIIEAYDAVRDPKYFAHAIGDNKEVNLSRGHIGCTMSHVHIWKMMQQRPDPFALVVEDDVIISGKVKELIEAAASQLSEDNICFVSMQVHQPIRFSIKKELPHRYFFCDCDGSIEGARGTQAYIVSKKVAAALAVNLYPVRYNVDTWPVYQQKGYFKNISVIFPFPIIHGEFLSDLHEESFTWKKSLKENIKSFVYRYKLWPLYNYFLSVRRKRVEKRHKENIFLNGKKVDRTFKL